MIIFEYQRETNVEYIRQSLFCLLESGKTYILDYPKGTNSGSYNRYFEVNGNDILFTDGNSTNTVDNKCLIPRKIIGIL